MANWDVRFMGLAHHISAWSKDPSTKVGAVIVDADRRVVGMGFNGFPRGVSDDPERYAHRETKYRMVVHAEANAILNAVSSARGCSLYVWPLFSCCECAKLVIQSGIRAVVAPSSSLSEERWRDSTNAALLMYREAGVECRFLPEVF